MIQKFTTKDQAQKFSDKIHLFLSENCINYNAVRWQTPKEIEKIFYVKIPREYKINLYKDCKTKISLFCLNEKAVSIGEVLKLPIIKEIEPIIEKPIINTKISIS